MQTWPGYTAPASTLYGSLGAVGESAYAAALASIVKRSGVPLAEGRLETRAIIQRQPDNEYDPNAVVVLLEGQRVGYIERGTAAAYQRALVELERRGFAPECEAVIAWRPDTSPIRMGVWLEIAFPDELEAWLGI